MQYELFHQLQRSLQSESGLVPSVDLYDFADDEIYAAAMNRLASPLPTGAESPFSSQDPGSAHAILVGILVYLQSLLAHEINLIPDYSLLWWLRLHGVRMRYAEYPIVAIEFRKDAYALDENLALEIPIGTELQSIYDPNLFAYTQESLIIPAGVVSAVVPARLSSLGELPVLRVDEFTRVPLGMSFVEGVRHTSVLSVGKPAEKLEEAVARLRDWLKTGDRIVTDRDSVYFARLGGAAKVNMIRGRHPGIAGMRRDLRTVAVYPVDAVAGVDLEMRERRMMDERLETIPAEIIPITGSITIKAALSISESQARALAVNAIINHINPPYGNWGDEDFEASLGTALEKTNGIFATSEMDLRHADGRKLSELKINPWNLFEVQQGLEIIVDR